MSLIPTDAPLLRSFLVAVLLGLAVAACGDDRNAAAPAADTTPAADTAAEAPRDTAGAARADTLGAMLAMAGRSVVYACEEARFVADVSPQLAVVTVDGRRYGLQPVESASGARYGDGAVTYWSSGEEARLELPGQTYRGCRADASATAWDEAVLRGAELRALGQEPGWFLEIDEGHRMALFADYGTRRVVTPAPSPEQKGDTTVYRAETEAHALRVEVTEEPCRDAMSGRPYPYTVAFTLDGTSYRGCGRRLGDA